MGTVVGVKIVEPLSVRHSCHSNWGILYEVLYEGMDLKFVDPVRPMVGKTITMADVFQCRSIWLGHCLAVLSYAQPELIAVLKRDGLNSSRLCASHQEPWHGCRAARICW